MKKIATFVVLSALATLSLAACPKKLAAATYSVRSEKTEYTSSEGVFLIKEHRVALFVVKIDGKGTATSPGILTFTGYGKRATSSTGTSYPVNSLNYKFDPTTCIISMDKNSNYYDAYKLIVSNSGSQIDYILFNAGVETNPTSVEIGVGYIQ